MNSKTVNRNLKPLYPQLLFTDHCLLTDWKTCPALFTILVSACLLGKNVRYNGQSLEIKDRTLQIWQKENRLIPFCPEIAGGLTIPRPPAEISGGDGHAVINGTAKVVSIEGADLSNPFIKGAHKALALCQRHSIKLAILAENSPSCGSNYIYDGTFTGVKIPGQGVTAALLQKNNIRVFNQFQIQEAAKAYKAYYDSHLLNQYK